MTETTGPVPVARLSPKVQVPALITRTGILQVGMTSQHLHIFPWRLLLCNAGHYMYIEATSANPGSGGSSAAILVSKAFSAVTKPNTCLLTMWYHMKGSRVGRLRVRKQSNGAQQNRYPLLFTVIGDQGDLWNNVTVDLYTSTYANDGFTVAIEARNIRSTSSDIAIDDLTFSAGCTGYFTGLLLG